MMEFAAVLQEKVDGNAQLIKDETYRNAQLLQDKEDRNSEILQDKVDRNAQLLQDKVNRNAELAELLQNKLDRNAQLLQEKVDRNAELVQENAELIQHMLPINPTDCSGRTGVTAIVIKDMITSDFDHVHVFCNNGWIVIQRRVSDQENFTRPWSDYKEGFGDLLKNYWLGLENMHRLTTQGNMMLRIELMAFDGETRYAEYKHISIDSEAAGYMLHFGDYSGNAGNSLSYHNYQKFSTYDVDNDNAGNCARHYESAWWYNNCFQSDLNGLYKSNTDSKTFFRISWDHWRDNGPYISATEMKIKYMNSV